MSGGRVLAFLLLASALGGVAFAGRTVDVAAIYALTGPASGPTAQSLQGVRNAVEEINGQGGVLGHTLNLVVLDNLSTPIGSRVAAERAVEMGVTAIVGANWSSHALAVAEVAQKSGIPMISTYATSPKVTRVGDYIFRVCYTDDFQGAVLARFAREDLGARTATVFTDITSDFSIGLVAIFRRDFEALGGRVVEEIEYKLKQEDFGPTVARATRAAADVALLSGHDESGLIAKVLQDAGVRSVPIGGDGWDAPAFFAKGGGALRRAYYCSHWSEDVESERSRSFVTKYSLRGNFGVGTALAYDAVTVLADAIRRAGTVNRAAIRAALAETRGFPGITGTLTFDEHGDPVKSVVVKEILDGRPRYLKTLNP